MQFALSSITENKFMINYPKSICDLFDWMGARALLKQSRMNEVQIEHEALRRKKDKDVGRAIHAAEQHIKITEENILEQFTKGKNDQKQNWARLKRVVKN